MISDSLMEAIDADDEPAQAITERPPTQEYIESLVRRLLDACRLPENQAEFGSGHLGKLSVELLGCFDVSGVVEAFIGQLTLAGSLSLSDPVVTVTQSQQTADQTFRFASSALLNTTELDRAMAKDESDRCLKAGQVMCCSFPRQNRIIESQMARIVPSLFRVFEPDARGIPSNALKVLLHMLNRNDNPIEHILNGCCRVTGLPYLQLLWRSALLDNSFAMTIFEKILFSTRPMNVLKPRLEKVGRMNLVEVTLNIVTQNVSDGILRNAVEMMSRLVEASSNLESLELIFSNFVDPENLIATEQLNLMFNALASSCNMQENQVPLFSETQFNSCLAMIHVLSIKTSGRCPVLPTIVELIEKPNLSAIKRMALKLIGNNMSALWGPESLLFGSVETSSPYDSCKTTSNRIMVLEMMVEAMFYFIVTAKTVPRLEDSRDAFLDSIPWPKLFELLWTRYKNASIYQSLLYKLVYMALGSQHENSVKVLCKSDMLIDSIVVSGERQGYFKLLVLAVEKLAKMHPESELGKHVLEKDDWIKSWTDCSEGGVHLLSRKEDEVLAHVMQAV